MRLTKIRELAISEPGSPPETGSSAWTLSKTGSYTVGMVKQTRSQLTTVGTGKTTLEGQTISYTVKRSSRAKHVRLEVRGETGLTVVVPGPYNVEELPNLLREKKRWILDKLAKYGKGHPLTAEKELKNGDFIPYLGRHMKVVERHDPRMADSAE